MCKCDNQAIETTSLVNRKLKTFRPCNSPYQNGVEAFNKLSPLPAGQILLDDERVLNVLEWAPVADETAFGGCDHIPITVRGFISLTPAARERLVQARFESSTQQKGGDNA